MSRHSEIKAEKDKANSRGHDMGNVVNVAPFFEAGVTTHYAVNSRCRKCSRDMYVQKNDNKVKSWGQALETDC